MGAHVLSGQVRERAGVFVTSQDESSEQNSSSRLRDVLFPVRSTSFTAREIALEKNGLRDVVMSTIRTHIQSQSKGSFDLICGGPAASVLAQMKTEARRR